MALITGMPTGGPSLLDMDEEHEAALRIAIERVNK